MKDEEKTKEQLIDELIQMRGRIAELEELENERKRTQEMLLNNQDRLDLALRSSKAGIWDRDIAADRATWDEHHHTLFGLAPGIFSGKLRDFLDMVHPEDRERVRSKIGAAMERQADYSTIYRVIWPDSSVHFVADRGKVYRDASGRAVRMTGVSLDVTELKQAEEALKLSETRLDLALRSANMGAWFWDLMEGRRYFDDQVCRLLGIDPVTFAGTEEQFYRVVHPGDRRNIQAALARTIEQDIPYQSEYRAVWADGSVHHIMARGRLVRDDSGRPQRLIGIIWDITEYKQMEDALRESEERRKQISDLIPDYAFSCVKQQGEEFIIDWLVGALEKITGYSIEEVLKKGCCEWAR